MNPYIDMILKALPGILTALGGLGIFRIIFRKGLKDATTAAVQEMVARNLMAAVEDLDPESYYTMDLEFPGGHKLHIPVLVGKPLMVLENISVAVISHSKQSTILSLTCEGFGHVDPHAHMHSTEEIMVIQGVITDTNTGRRYGPGEKWVVPAGEFHGAILQNVTAILLHHPPLPTARERPVSLAAMSSIYTYKP